MSDLEDLVEPLKREVAVPGTFASVYTETTDPDLVGSLLDAFAQCQLDGFLSSSTVTEDGIVSPDLSLGAQALITIYAGVRILTTALINRKSHVKYMAAGGNEFEQDYAASVMVQVLKDLTAKRTNLVALAQYGTTTTTVYDGYFIRAVDFFPLEYNSNFWREPMPGLA